MYGCGVCGSVGGQVMEQRSTDLIVIFAGYKDKMDSFFSYIPGE